MTYFDTNFDIRGSNWSSIIRIEIES